MAYPVVIRELPSQNEVDYRFVVGITDINNGTLLTPSEEIAVGEGPAGTVSYRDVYEIGTLNINTFSDLWIATGVEALYETGKHLDDYTNMTGMPFRAEHLVNGCIYAISSDGLTIATPATDMVAGATAVATSSGVIAIKRSPASGDQKIGKVVDVYTKGGKTFVSIMFKDIND